MLYADVKPKFVSLEKQLVLVQNAEVANGPKTEEATDMNKTVKCCTL